MSQKSPSLPDSGKEQHTNIIELSSFGYRRNPQTGVTPKKDPERLQEATRKLVILHSNLSELKEKLEALQKVLAGTSEGRSGLMEAVRKHPDMLRNLNVQVLHDKVQELTWSIEKLKAR